MQINTDKPTTRVMLVEDDVALCCLFKAWLNKAGMDVVVFQTVQECLHNLDATLCDVVCLDINLPDGSGIEVLDRIRRQFRYLPVVMTTAEAGVEAVVDATRRGAHDYLVKPVERQKLITTLSNAAQHHQMQIRIDQFEQERDSPQAFWGIKGHSPAMHRLFRELSRVAASDITVLLNGESGTGKELVARALHDHSARCDGPFVAINCAAIPESLQDAELFGYEKGAFTGANRRQIGRLEQADGGTLFLDELGELRPALQAKLLRALQERRFRRVGGQQEIAPDFRLLAATHKDLRGAIAEGAFREDLYFRIAVFELKIPPLRQREGDVALLAHAFAQELAPDSPDRTPVTLSPEALSLLQSHDWPGNVRELRNAIERALVVCDHRHIRPHDLPPSVYDKAAPTNDASSHQANASPDDNNAPASPTPSSALAAPSAPNTHDAHTLATDAPRSHDGNGHTPYTHPTEHAAAAADKDPSIYATTPREIVIREPITLAEAEHRIIRFAMEHADSNISFAARILGTSRSTLYRKLRQYNIPH